MSVDELLADLRERIDRGVDELEELASDHEGGREEIRLLGKASGLLVVRDWLRSYDAPENVECQTCEALGEGVFDPDYFCPKCSTPPEYVEEPTWRP